MVDCLGEAKTSYRYAAPGQFCSMMHFTHEEVLYYVYLCVSLM